LYIPKLLDRYLSGGNGRMQNLEGYKGALSVRDVGLDDVNEATSTGDAVIHALLKRGPRKYITVAVSCEAAVDFDIDFSVDDGETYVAGSTVTIQMDGAGSAIENIINQRPDLTHIKVTPSGAGTYTVVTTVSSHAPSTNANVLVDGLMVASDNPLPQEQIVDGAAVSATNPLPVTSGTQSTIAQAIEDIVDIVGLENIRLFLPMWEAAGSTKVYDLFRKDLSFTVATSVTLGAATPFGLGATLDGTGYLKRDPVTESATAVINSEVKLDGGTKKLATRINKIATNPDFIRSKLKRYGTLANATLKFSVYSEAASLPNAVISNGASNALACSSIGTSGWADWGFPFATDPTTRKDANFWLVMEYAALGGDTVDANNCISWAHDNGLAGGYGTDIAIFNGATWTRTAGKSHYFALWDDSLNLSLGDFSIIVLASDTNGTVAGRALLGTASQAAAEVFEIAHYSYGDVIMTANDGSQRTGQIQKFPVNTFNVYGLTFSKAKDAGKVNGYLNGINTVAVAGTLNAALTKPAHPLSIGGSTSTTGTISNKWVGTIGPVIITANELTQAQIAEITKNLYILRRYGSAL